MAAYNSKRRTLHKCGVAVAKKCREIVLIKTFNTANWYFDSMDEQKPLFGDRAR